MTRWLPNAVSLLRVPLAFLLVLVFHGADPQLPLALAVFLAAAVSDKLDGMLARRWGVSSYRGYLIDGFADRTFSAACILLAVAYFSLPLWAALVAIAREFLLYTSRLLLAATWHPLPRTARLHSLVLFGLTRVWFLLLLLLALQDWRGALALTLVNGAYAIGVLTSFLVLSSRLIVGVARCFGDEPS